MEIKYDAILGKLREKDSGGGALTPATKTALGGIKVGAGLTVALDGLLSAALPTLTQTTITTSQTWTAPADGVVFLVLVGGGGRGADGTATSGGSAGGGGAGGDGGRTIAFRALVAGDSIVIVIGAAGNASHPDGGKTTATLNAAAQPFAEAGGGGAGAASVRGGAGGAGGSGTLPGPAGNMGNCLFATGASAPGGTGNASVPGGGGEGGTAISGGTSDTGFDGADGIAHIFFFARPAAQ